MKKTIALSLLMLTLVCSAYAATPGDLASGSVSQDGLALYGGITSATAAVAPSPLVKFSSKVNGMPSYDSTQYVIATKHQTGNKVFGTSNDATQIYWKQSVAGILTNAANMGAGADLTIRCVGGGWTAY